MSENNFSLKNFVDLKNEDLLMVLNWRNHPSVRSYMFNDNIISIKEHEDFIFNLKSDKSKHYFLVYDNDISVGVIYIKENEICFKECEFGIYLNPDFKGKGYGKKLSEVEINYAFNVLNKNKIILSVIECNKVAINIYKKMGFNEIGIQKFKNKNFIKMELIKS